MVLSIASGKGGTGKTTFAVNLAVSLEKAVFLDCDVEEPNAHIFLKPRITERFKATVPVPVWDESRCTYCGTCAEVCAYKAIAVIKGGTGGGGSVLLFPHLCHGCGACSLLCPSDALSETTKEIGTIEIGRAGDIDFAHGRLTVGEILSPVLIRQVKARIPEYERSGSPIGAARGGAVPRVEDRGSENHGGTDDQSDCPGPVIIDAPPGTSCPFVAAVRGTDYCILVTEPTPFGLNDLALAAEVCESLRIAHGVVINRDGIGDNKVDRYCRQKRIPVLMRIPYSRTIATHYAAGIPYVERMPDFKVHYRQLFDSISEMVHETNRRR